MTVGFRIQVRANWLLKHSCHSQVESSLSSKGPPDPRDCCCCDCFLRLCGETNPRL